MQAPIELDIALAGQRAPHRGDEFAQMVDLAVADAADRRHGLDRDADHEARRGRALIVGAEAAAQGRPDQRAQHRIDSRPPAAGFLGGLEFGEPLAVQREAAGDEQFRDQLVLGAEMVVHGGEVDIRFGHDVAQRHVAEAALGIEPFGGGENGGSGLIARHGSFPASRLHFKHMYETIV